MNEPSNPRAFAQGTGHVFTIVGLVLMLGGCCIGSFSGLFQGEQLDEFANFAEWVRRSPRGQLLTGINIIVTGAVGLAMITFGIGLQQERRGSGTGAVITAGVLAMAWWGTTIASLIYVVTAGSASFGGTIPVVFRLIVQILLAVGATVLVLLAAAARRNLKLNPPPPDEPVTQAFLDELRSKRRHM
jgi:hypothetical protein